MEQVISSPEYTDIKSDRLVLNGVKTLISRADEAALFVVFSRIDRMPGREGIGCVLVDRARACDGSLPTCTRISRRAARFCTALHRACASADPFPDPPLAATAKVFCNEMAVRVTGEAIQIHGGYGFTNEFAVSRLYRGARYGSLGDGTSETLRDSIGKRLIANVNDSDGIFGLLDT